jgi:phosphonate transport system substrate-binding protein
VYEALSYPFLITLTEDFMMSFTMTISPDFKPELISGWYLFNTWLQKKIDTNIHINLVNDFNELSKNIDDNAIDLIYANPCDIAKLVREKSFTPMARPVGSHDETIIICSSDKLIDNVESLETGIKIAMTDVPDVNTIGMIMLEPADISSSDVDIIHCSNYITVVKKVINGEADIGFLLADAYGEFSKLVKSIIQPVITSKIHVLHHALLVGPDFSEKQSQFQEAILNMHNDQSGTSILKSLELEKWERMDQDEAEFLIDLIDTLSP